VDDLSTALIMTKFYELHLRGEPTAGVPPLPAPAALRRAQIRLRVATVAELGLAERAERRFEASGQQDTEALKAMHWHRANPAAVLFADPYCWAPFVFIGA
jgi:CHAT domain-containing protein